MSAALAGQQVKESLSCPVSWVYFRRSCGSWQASPAGCRDLLCPDCQRRWAAEARSRWFPTIEAMKSPRMLTLTVKSGFDLGERSEFERRSFRRFLDLRMGPRNWPQFKAEAAEFLAAQLAKSEPDVRVRAERFEAQADGLEGLERRIKKYHAERGEWPRVRDVLKCGLSSVEVTWGDEYGWHPHRHLVYDGWYAPQALWCVLWRRATKGDAYIVWVSYKRPDYETSLELVKYLSKPGSVPAERADEFRSVLRHVKKVWPIGDAEPAEPEPHPCPICGSLNCFVEPWTVQTGSTLYYDGKEARVQVASGVLFLRKGSDGAWRDCLTLRAPLAEQSLKSRHEELACHSRARDGPKEPSSGFDGSLLEVAYGAKADEWWQN